MMKSDVSISFMFEQTMKLLDLAELNFADNDIGNFALNAVEAHCLVPTDRIPQYKYSY